MKELIHTDQAHRGLGPYSQAIRAKGFVFVSGQLALDPVTGEIVGDDIRTQVLQALRNAGAILDAAGSSWKDVVKVTLFLRNIDDFAPMNEIYTTAIVDIPPARSAVEVGRLPRNALVELDVIALAPASTKVESKIPHLSSQKMFDDQLNRLGIELPEPSKPGATYVPYVQTGNLVFLTGQLSQWNGERRYMGKLGREFELDDGRLAARLCALNLIAQLRVALDGDWNRLVKFVRIAGFVNSMADFTAQSQVIDGASDLFVEVFGDLGRHSRIAVGVSALPYNVAVEVEAIVEVR